MNKTISVLYMVAVGFAFVSCASTPIPNDAETTEERPYFELPKTCLNDETIQKKRSKELQHLLSKDLSDRNKPYDQLNWTQISKNDLIHRKAVGEIFAEGCIRSPQDYAAAAIIFNHGDTADHAYQAYLWSQSALSADPKNMNYITASSIDNYMTRKGYKQLFGLMTAFSTGHGCQCLYQIESTFPDSLRVKYTGRTLKQLIEVHHKKNTKPECKDVPLYCKAPLEPPPKGHFKDIW